jgi:hypothetical protein
MGVTDEEYGYSKPRALGLFALTVLLVGTSLWCTRLPDPMMRGVGWLGAAFFALGFPATGKMLLTAGPVLRLTAEGFEDRRNPFGVIPWSAIKGAWIGQVYGQPLVSLELFDPDPFLAKLSPMKRSVALSNKAMGFSPVTLSTVGLAISANDLVEAVNRRVAR